MSNLIICVPGVNPHDSAISSQVKLLWFTRLASAPVTTWDSTENVHHCSSRNKDHSIEIGLCSALHNSVLQYLQYLLL